MQDADGWAARALTVAAAFLFLVGPVPPAAAQIPELITYQGRLLDNLNQPVNGCIDITFRIYDGQGQGATLLWTEAHTAGNCVQVTNGQFTVDLGSLNMFNTVPLLFDIQYFLGIQVDQDAEMVPRKPFTSVGYALHAVNSQNAEQAANAMNADNASNASQAQNANRADRSDFSVGVKEDRLAMVMVGLRGGDTPTATSAIYADPVLAMNDVATWCGTPTMTTPCLLQILPGTYNIGAADLVMQPWVDIQGSGVDVTRIQTTGTVQVQDNSQIRSLTIEKQGGANPAVSVNGSSLRMEHLNIEVLTEIDAIRNAGFSPQIDGVTISGCPTPAIGNSAGAAPEITHTTINTANCGSSAMIGIKNDASLPTLRGVEVVVSSSNNEAIGMQNTNGGEIEATNVSILAEGTGTSSGAIGIDNNDSTSLDLVGCVVRATHVTLNSTGVSNLSGATANIDQSVLSGETWAVDNQGGSASIGTTKLDGGAGGSQTSYTCFGVYDETYQALQTNCKP